MGKVRRNIDTSQVKRVLLSVGSFTSVVLSHFEVVEGEIKSFDWVLGNGVHENICAFCLPSRIDYFAIDCVCVMTFNIARNYLNLDRDVEKNTRVVCKLDTEIMVKDTCSVCRKGLESYQSHAIVLQVGLGWDTCIKNVV